MGSKTPPSDRLAAWIAGQRWFASKTRGIVGAVVEDRVPIGAAALHVVRVTLDDGTTERYAMPLAPAAPGSAPADALDDPSFCRTLLALLADGGVARGERGTVATQRTRAFPLGVDPQPVVRRLGGEQSNTSVTFDRALILKHFRRLVPGLNPEIEMTRFLTERTGFRHTPRLAGWFEYRDGSESSALAIVQELVPDAQDGWRWLLGRLAEGDGALAAIRQLGDRTAGLHRALASDTTDPDFAPEPISVEDVARWEAAIRAQLAAARDALGSRAPAELATEPAGLEALVGLVRMRHHGDFHLGQTLRDAARDDFLLIDFEGEPLRPLAERRAKHSPLRDVAGMLRSLAYAAETARDRAHGAWLADWERAARAAFVDGYLAVARPAPFVPADDAAVRRVVAVFELEKAAYEVVYEANNRPDWIEIPLRGVVSAARTLRAT